MNPASAWRTDLAARLAAIYAQNPKVQVVVLAGSTARGLADAHSDIELDVFWSAPPSDRERHAAIDHARGIVVGFWPFEDDEWSEAYTVAGLRVDLSSFLVKTFDRYLSEVVDAADTHADKQFLIFAIQTGVGLVDKDGARLAAWRSRADEYPEALARAMIAAHLQPDRRWSQRRAMVARDDLLCLHEMLLETTKRLLCTLSGLNRIYLGHPTFKWLAALSSEMKLCPPNLLARLERVLRGAGPSAVSELEQLIEETCSLVALNLPGAGAEQALARFIEARPSFDEPVPG